MLKFLRCHLLWLLMCVSLCGHKTYANTTSDSSSTNTINAEVRRLMKKGKIPGLSLVIIQGGHTYINHFGYADLEQKKKVSSQTLFEVGSCTKAFTGLALLDLDKKGLVAIDSPVSVYLPWFHGIFNGRVVAPTLRQLMYHTSGIPWNTLTQIPEGNGIGALKNTVKKIVGIQLNNLPGIQYEYSSTNYDILGLVIEETTRQTFESYIEQSLLKPLGMAHSKVGYVVRNSSEAQGYKTGFFEPRAYDAPLFRGNSPAAYLMTDSRDLSKWLGFQLGQMKTGTVLDTLLVESRKWDDTVPLDRASLSAYACGWQVFMTGRGLIGHSGLNPSFSSHIDYIPEKQLAVGVLTNLSTGYTDLISDHILKMLLEEKITADPPMDDFDKYLSVISFFLAAYTGLVFFYILMRIYSFYRGTARLKRYDKSAVVKFLVGLLPLCILFVAGYLLPGAIAGFSWEAALVWTPVSFPVAVCSLIVAAIMTYLGYIVNVIFPDDNKYINAVPELTVLTLLSGVANAVVIVLVTQAISTVSAGGHGRKIEYILFYFLMAFLAYIISRKIVQTKLIRLTSDLVLDTRMQLLNRVFSTPYEDFEKMDRGKIYSTLSSDTDSVGNAAVIIVNLGSHLITVVAVFSYLMAMSLEASILTILSIIVIGTVYYAAYRKSNGFYESVRDTLDRYLEMLNGMIDGFKELTIHTLTRLGYKRDLEDVNKEFNWKLTSARINFINAYLIGESLLIIILALVAFGFPIFFSAIDPGTILNYVVIMLYLVGPINNILNSIPSAIQVRISWKRIQLFMQKLPAPVRVGALVSSNFARNEIEHLSVEGLRYEYEDEVDKKGFEVGPIGFELRKGEAIFVTGGNGSGKTTLSKLLTGLYASEGHMKINGKAISATDLSEYFSVVFNPFHLFRKIYSFDAHNSLEEIDKYFEVLGLSGKLTISGNSYSTINLSQGQRKRLALLQCCLENRPIYLLDEWAADQDPDYRRFFYNTFIPAMKREGKMLIIISHDEQYFGVADQIIKLNQGKQELSVMKEQIV